ncbi:protein-disulfide reductase DsbD family protein [Alphaproteobacteria bacterium]|nr:protein-disulfide reductase DsbD family protein [Alphaproteobacteria bacterium]MDC1157047.1 protein-disulfide reductase DsbD family protein [Alphaproteobacteria bacterium]
MSKPSISKRSFTMGDLRQIRPLCRFLAGWFMALLLVMLGSAAPLYAASQSNMATGAWVGDPAYGEVRLVSAVSAMGNLQELPLGLEFRLAPGWKIYWRTPGEAGLPPTLDLQMANGAPLQSQIEWPVPKRFNAFGFDNFGYADAVILPVAVRGHDRGAALQIRGQIEALFCSDICVPLAGVLRLDLADGPAEPSSMAMVIAQFAAKVPRIDALSPIKIATAWQSGSQLKIGFAATSQPVTEIFVEGPAGIAFKQPVFANNIAVIDVEGDLKTPLAGQTVDLTVIAGDDFTTQSITVAKDAPLAGSFAAGKPMPTDAGAMAQFWTVIGFAFLGGLILNLMPCVLPVLAIKLAAIIEASGQSRGFVRLRFGAGAMGILSSFAILAAGLVALRLAGGQIGWGIQFQSPVFLAIMLLVLGLFTLNMLDRFFLPIPAFLQASFRGDGQNTNGQNTNQQARSAILFGDFMAGMLATLLATPCSAPFVGSAVTVALTGDMAQLFAVFMAMGAGLAAPWGLVVLFPALVGFLPRPGHWMVWLKRGLAGLLIATMIWLGWLLQTIQGGPAALLLFVLIGFVLLAILCRQKIGILLAGAGLFAGLAFLPAPAIVAPQANGLVWQVWSNDASAAARAEGKLVFVDVTADWCITCKANKALILETAPIAPMLAALVDDGKLVMLKADWTRPDPRIAAFLASHDRFGIPFNIIYGPKAPEGVLLGELLRADMVENALIKAGMTR